MGYFSNASEADLYEEKVCEQCVHHGKCSVWDLHLDYASEPDNEFLNTLIPRGARGANLMCTMFIAKRERR